MHQLGRYLQEKSEDRYLDLVTTKIEERNVGTPHSPFLGKTIKKLLTIILISKDSFFADGIIVGEFYSKYLYICIYLYIHINS